MSLQRLPGPMGNEGIPRDCLLVQHVARSPGLVVSRVVGKRVEEYVPHRNARWAQHSERGEPVSDIEFLHQDLSVFGSAQDQP